MMMMMMMSLVYCGVSSLTDARCADEELQGTTKTTGKSHMENGWGWGGAWIRGSVHTSEVKRKVFRFFLNTTGVSTLFSASSRGFQSFGTAFLKALAPDHFLFVSSEEGRQNSD